MQQNALVEIDRQGHFVAGLKVVLDNIVLRLDVPLHIRLNQLHEALQAALSRSNNHLYELVFKGVGFGPSRPRLGRRSNGHRKAKLIDIL